MPPKLPTRDTVQPAARSRSATSPASPALPDWFSTTTSGRFWSAEADEALLAVGDGDATLAVWDGETGYVADEEGRGDDEVGAVRAASLDPPGLRSGPSQA